MEWVWHVWQTYRYIWTTVRRFTDRRVWTSIWNRDDTIIFIVQSPLRVRLFDVLRFASGRGCSYIMYLCQSCPSMRGGGSCCIVMIWMLKPHILGDSHLYSIQRTHAGSMAKSCAKISREKNVQNHPTRKCVKINGIGGLSHKVIVVRILILTGFPCRLSRRVWGGGVGNHPLTIHI